MPLVKIYGCSDDLIEVSGVESAADNTPNHGQDDDYYPEGANNTAEFPVYEDVVFVLGDRITIRPVYDGNWSFGAGIYDPALDEPGYPDWPTFITQSADCPYSVELNIEVPDGYNHIRRVK